MNYQIISKFRETSKTKAGKWAFGLSIVAILSGPILGVSAAVIVPLINDLANSELIGQIVGFTVMAMTVTILVSTFALSIRAFTRGERSWQVWLALGFSIASVCFLIFLIVGELLFPH